MAKTQCWLATAVVLMACAGFPAAMWWVADSSFKSAQHAQQQQPPRNDGAAQAIHDKNQANNGVRRLEIECAPDCKAKDSKHGGDDHPVSKFVYKVLADPIALLTTGILVANSVLAGFVLCQVRDFRNFNRRQSRAYVGHEPNGAKFVSTGYVQIEGGMQENQVGTVKYYEMNFGQTPALDVEMYVKVVKGTQVPGDLGGTLGLAEKQDVIGYVPKGQNIGRILQTPGHEWTRLGDPFFLYGYVDYSDVFGRRCRHRFAFSHDSARGVKKGEAWVAHGEHHHERRLRRVSGAWVEFPASDEAN